MSRALALFLRRQLEERGETAEQFGKRIGLNSSGIYQILREQRQYVQDRTLDKIAEGLGMTPAEMAVAIGKGTPQDDPEESEVLALWRQLHPDRKPAAREILQGWAVQPINRGPDNRRRDGQHNRSKRPAAQHDVSHGQQDENGDQGQITVCSSDPWARLRSVVGGLEVRLPASAVAS